MYEECMFDCIIPISEDSCWATSHGECEKKQIIDLGYSGFDAAVLDEEKPEIKISEWLVVKNALSLCTILNVQYIYIHVCEFK